MEERHWACLRPCNRVRGHLTDSLLRDFLLFYGPTDKMYQSKGKRIYQPALVENKKPCPCRGQASYTARKSASNCCNDSKQQDYICSRNDVSNDRENH